MQSSEALFDDPQLLSALRRLREDVAAPANFRAQVLGRLRAQGLISDIPLVEPQRAWWQLPALPFGFAAAAALAVVLLWQAPSAPRPEHLAALPQTVAVSAPKQAVPTSAPVLAKALTPKQAKSQAAVALVATAPSEAMQEAAIETAAAAQPAPWVGAQAPAPASVSHSGAQAAASTAPLPQFAGGASTSASSSSLVAGVTPGTGATPGSLAPYSQLRSNVMRVSRGDKAFLVFTLIEAGQTRVDIHDRLGKRIAVLHDGWLAAGDWGQDKRFSWDGRDEDGQAAPSGIYELRIVGPGLQTRHKLALVR